MSQSAGYSVNPKSRHVIVEGGEVLRALHQTIKDHAGIVADLIDLNVILETLLEEYFYGNSFNDSFHDILSNYRVTTDRIHKVRLSGMQVIADQVRLALGEIKPSCVYSFRMLSSDVLVTECPPKPMYRDPAL